MQVDSSVAEEEITKAVTDEKMRLWKIENREIIRDLNDYVEKYGLPLDRVRQF